METPEPPGVPSYSPFVRLPCIKGCAPLLARMCCFLPAEDNGLKSSAAAIKRAEKKPAGLLRTHGVGDGVPDILPVSYSRIIVREG